MFRDFHAAHVDNDHGVEGIFGFSSGFVVFPCYNVDLNMQLMFHVTVLAAETRRLSPTNRWYLKKCVSCKTTKERFSRAAPTGGLPCWAAAGEE
jgi:hypothetical protein